MVMSMFGPRDVQSLCPNAVCRRIGSRWGPSWAEASLKAQEICLRSSLAEAGIDPPAAYRNATCVEEDPQGGLSHSVDALLKGCLHPLLSSSGDPRTIHERRADDGLLEMSCRNRGNCVWCGGTESRQLQVFNFNVLLRKRRISGDELGRKERSRKLARDGRKRHILPTFRTVH